MDTKAKFLPLLLMPRIPRQEARNNSWIPTDKPFKRSTAIWWYQNGREKHVPDNGYEVDPRNQRFLSLHTERPIHARLL